MAAAVSMGAFVSPLYMSRPMISKCSARVMEIGQSELNKKIYKWVQLDQTIFHPKGGGQLADKGTINKIPVVHVHKELVGQDINVFKILHCFDSEAVLDFEVGQNVDLEIDMKERMMNAKIHTGGHALADATRSCFPHLVGYQGNHAPGDSYVKFRIQTTEKVDSNDVKGKVQTQVSAFIEQDLPVKILDDQGMRKIQIGDYEPVGCGGTHIDSLKQLGNLSVKDVKVNAKEATVTIKYEVKG